MIQKKEMTQVSNSAGGYLAPKVKVKELWLRRTVCTGSGGYWNNPGSEPEQEGY